LFQTVFGKTAPVITSVKGEQLKYTSVQLLSRSDC